MIPCLGPVQVVVPGAVLGGQNGGRGQVPGGGGQGPQVQPEEGIR